MLQDSFIYVSNAAFFVSLWSTVMMMITEAAMCAEAAAVCDVKCVYAWKVCYLLITDKIVL